MANEKKILIKNELSDPYLNTNERAIYDLSLKLHISISVLPSLNTKDSHGNHIHITFYLYLL